MAAQYDLKKSVRPKGKEDETVLYPKVVPYGTKTLKNIMKDASKYTGLNPSTVQGVVTFLEDMMTEYLANGYNVKLGNIGTFSASLTSRKVTDKKEIRANSIHFDNVHFKATKELKNSIDRQMKLERVAPYRAFKTSSEEYTPDERFQLLQTYLDKHGFITRAQYSELTGVLKTKAAAELRQWSEEGKINRQGRAPHIVYKKSYDTDSALQPLETDQE